MPPAEPCPCGSGQAFSACCEPVIALRGSASTALQLMRSRYSAFARGDARHILASHQDSMATISPEKIRHLQAELHEQNWLALRILDSHQGSESDTHGTVEFCAFYRTRNGRVEQLHEHSRFVRDESGWLYVDGDPLPPVAMGRNDPCWCGSGRKYKKCHLDTM